MLAEIKAKKDNAEKEREEELRKYELKLKKARE